MARATTRRNAFPRVVLVTGAARGIGLVIALRLARQGDHVVLMDVLPAVKDSARALKDGGHAAEAMVLDITREKAVARAMAAVMQRHGRVDVLVNRP